MNYDFVTRFEKMSGITHRVDSVPAAANKIAQLCRDRQVQCIALACLPEDLVARIKACCKGVTVLTEPYDSTTLVAQIDRAEIGITGISFAIAQSGTMVEVADNDAVRLVSSLPRTHIGVLREENIIDRYNDSASAIRELINDHQGSLVISFISGPSRTGDIELKLTLGVHGPEEAHCLIISTAA